MCVAKATRYECHRISNYCSKSAWIVFGYYDTQSSKWVTHGWWQHKANTAKTYCFYRGQSLWMYWDWDLSYGYNSDISFPLPGDWTACTCTSKQKIYYSFSGHPFYEEYSKNNATSCSNLGLRNCLYRKLEKVDSLVYGGSDVRQCTRRRRLGDVKEEKIHGENSLVVGETVAYEDIPKDQLDELVFVAEDKGIQEAK